MLSLTDAAGDTQPPTGAVTNFTDTVCNEPRDAAKQLLSAFEAGGSQAQVGWVKGQGVPGAPELGGCTEGGQRGLFNQ